VKRAELLDLHFITPMSNVRSILGHGILSHRRAADLTKNSFALETAQARRATRVVVPPRVVHEYANLYFDAHNPALSRIRDRNDSTAVLRVAAEVVDIPGAIIATCNAASPEATFLPSPAGLEALDASLLYAAYWSVADEAETKRRKREKCAELLVPDVVEAKFILGAVVANDRARASLGRQVKALAIDVRPDLFFGTDIWS
jgi:hypothetical protein